MKLNIYILSFFLLIVTLSCEKKRDRVFEQGPTERLNESVAKSYAVLQENKEGWLIKYFPSNTREFGGYTLFVKFISVTEVEVEGELFRNMSTSNYTIYPGSGPILTFDTYNPIIHHFALPGVYTDTGASDSGFKGDFEFLVQKATADSVTLEGRKTYNKIIMVPVKESDMNIQAYQDAVAKFHPFSNYTVEVGDQIFTTSFGNSSTKRALRIGTESTIYSYRYTPAGFEFYQEYEFEGIKFKALNYVEPTGNYGSGYFTDEANLLKLIPGN